MNARIGKSHVMSAVVAVMATALASCAQADSTVTASREYVNRKFNAALDYVDSAMTNQWSITTNAISASSTSATNYVDSATNDVLVAAQGYTDEKISEIPAADFSTNNVELVETIEATAPPPGDYAAVSNAAVHAAITNALQDAAIASLVSSVSAVGNAATNYVDSATNDVLVAAQGYTDEKISEIPAADFSTNNVELVETIEATAPPPGDYAAVSNAAVHAAITNALQDAAITALGDGKVDKIASPAAGNFVIQDTNGNISDSGVSTNLYLKKTGDTMAGPLDMASYSIHQITPFGKEYWLYPGKMYMTGGYELEFPIKNGVIATVDDIDSATNGVLSAAQGYTDEKISGIPASDFSTNNVELVETIEATAPPPGDYAAVSNAAVCAAITNALQDAALANLSAAISGLETKVDGKQDALSERQIADIDAVQTKVSVEDLYGVMESYSTNYVVEVISNVTAWHVTVTNFDAKSGYYLSNDAFPITYTSSGVPATINSNDQLTFSPQPDWPEPSISMEFGGRWIASFTIEPPYVYTGHGELSDLRFNGVAPIENVSPSLECIEQPATYVTNVVGELNYDDFKDGQGRSTIVGTPEQFDISITNRVVMTTVPAQIGMATNDIAKAIVGKADKADATLTPIYSDNPTYGEWSSAICEPSSIEVEGVTFDLHAEERFISQELGYRYFINGIPRTETSLVAQGGPTPVAQGGTSFSVPVEVRSNTSSTVLERVMTTATRVRTDIVGYQLGSQTNKVLASEAEVEELRTNKVSVADFVSSTNTLSAAIAGKVSTNDFNTATNLFVKKSGDAMTGSLSMPSLTVPDSSAGDIKIENGSIKHFDWGYLDWLTYTLPYESGTLALTSDISSQVAAAVTTSTNYTDRAIAGKVSTNDFNTATNGIDIALALKADKADLAAVAQSATNYVDSATNGLWTATTAFVQREIADDLASLFVEWAEPNTPNNTAGGYAIIFFKPSAFGATANCVVRRVTVRSATNSATLPTVPVYAKIIDPDNTSTALAVSQAVSMTAADTDYDFIFSGSPSLTYTKQYRLVFYVGPEDGVQQVAVGVRLYVASVNQDIYYSSDHQTWRPITKWLYSQGSVSDALALKADKADLAAVAQSATNYVDSATNSLAVLRTEKRYALFLVDCNYDKSETTYVGFELKASTNNFSHATDEDVGLQFYAQSEIADSGRSKADAQAMGTFAVDRMKLFACTSVGSTDVRAWTAIGNTLSWEGYPQRFAVLVDVSCLERHKENDGEWLSEGNEDIVWSYCRTRRNEPAYEEELTRIVGQSHSLWRPIQPIRWYSKLPNWAVQE